MTAAPQPGRVGSTGARAVGAPVSLVRGPTPFQRAAGWVLAVMAVLAGLFAVGLGVSGEAGGLFMCMLFAIAIGTLALLCLCRRTVFDATGIHTRVLGFRRDIPWPRSRSDLFVKRPSAPPLLVIFLGLVLIVLAFLAGDAGDAAGVSMSAKAYVRVPRGRAVWLPGLTRRGLLRSTMERRGNAELDRIWAWAVARGYTQETGTPARS